MIVPPNSRRPSISPESSSILVEELIAEILSFLPVKTLIQLKCICKSWYSLISNPTFIQTHLKRSSQNPQIALFRKPFATTSVVPISVHRLVEDPSKSITLTNDPYYRLNDDNLVVGSCNGLLCLLDYSQMSNYHVMWFRLWNPAIRIISENLGYLGYFRKIDRFDIARNFKFGFGYDNSRDTYKVVALRLDETKVRTIVGIYSLCDNVWKDLQDFPMVPLHFNNRNENCGTYFSNSLNWLARDDNPFDDYYHHDRTNQIGEKFVIVSLDLGKETYKMLLPPQGFDEAPFVDPALSVLMDCLCFSHDFNKTHFIIWKMKDFGVEKSWTQFLKISYENLKNKSFGFVEVYSLQPLCLTKNGGTLILANDTLKQAVLYNLRDDRVVRTRVNNICCFVFAKGYVESLVPYC